MLIFLPRIMYSKSLQMHLLNPSNSKFLPQDRATRIVRVEPGYFELSKSCSSSFVPQFHFLSNHFHTYSMSFMSISGQFKMIHAKDVGQAYQRKTKAKFDPLAQTNSPSQQHASEDEGSGSGHCSGHRRTRKVVC